MKRGLLTKAGLAMAALIIGGFAVVEAQVTVGATGADYTNIPDAITNTTAGETITVIDQGTYGAFAVQDRVFISDPAGATISGGTVLIQDPAGSTTSFDGFIFDGSANALFMDGSGGSAGTLILNNCTVSNQSSHGVLFNLEEGGTLEATNTQFSNCGENAITLFRNATVTLTDSTLTNNGAGTGSGRGILVDGNPSDATGRVVTLDNTTITGSAGAGLTTFRFGTYTIQNGSSIDTNGTYGIFADGDSTGSTIVIDNSSLSSNALDGLAFFRPGDLSVVNGAAVDNNGLRGLNMEDFSSSTIPAAITLTDSSISGNGGHGLFHKSSGADTTFIATGMTVNSNAGRGLSVEGTPPTSEIIATVADSTFTDGSGNGESSFLGFDLGAGSVIQNNLVDGGAAGLALNRLTADVLHNTIINCPGGIDIFDGQDNPIDIRNNILAYSGNGLSADTGAGGGIGLTNLTVDYNLFSDNGTDFNSVFTTAAGSNNVIGSSPSFVSYSATPGAGDYQLQLGSAAIAAGDAAAGLTTDIVGGTRPAPAGTDPDIGAYEFDQSSHVPSWQMF